MPCLRRCHSASQRARDALKRKAERGYNTGGIVYGYDNIKKEGSHTDYAINETQADVIRRIYRMYIEGHGHTVIAKTMNGDPRYAKQNLKYFDGKTPTPPRKGTGSWAPASVRKILHNERYTGKVTFGKHRNKYLARKRVRDRQKDSDIHVAERPDLRIIPEKLWLQVQKRLSNVRKTYIRDTGGTLWGRPDTGRESQYLLTGLMRCDECGASMLATKLVHGSRGNRRNVHHYGCSYYSNRGKSVCANSQKPLMTEVDARVLEAIETTILTPAAVDYVIEQAIHKINEQQAEQPNRKDELAAETTKVQKELDRFMQLIANGKAPATILAEIASRENG